MKSSRLTLPYLGVALLSLTACDPQSSSIDLSAQQGAANSPENPTFEVLGVSNTYRGSFEFITIESQGVISNASNGTLTNPIKLINNEPFTIAWSIDIEEQSVFTLELKKPSNPDLAGGGFFNFNTCLEDGGCTKSSTTCEYYKNTNITTGKEIIGRSNCEFLHPDLGIPITNGPDFKGVLDTTIDQLPKTYELQAELCGSGQGCTTARVGYVEINMD